MARWGTASAAAPPFYRYRLAVRYCFAAAAWLPSIVPGVECPAEPLGYLVDYLFAIALLAFNWRPWSDRPGHTTSDQRHNQWPLRDNSILTCKAFCLCENELSARYISPFNRPVSVGRLVISVIQHHTRAVAVSLVRLKQPRDGRFTFRASLLKPPPETGARSSLKRKH